MEQFRRDVKKCKRDDLNLLYGLSGDLADEIIDLFEKDCRKHGKPSKKPAQ